MLSTDPLALLGAMRQMPTLKERMETALKSKNYPEHLKPPLRALLKGEAKLSVSYFVWAAEWLLNKGTAIVQSRKLLSEKQAAILKAALDLRKQFLAHFEANPENQITPAADLIRMFERHLAGTPVSDSPRCEEELVITPEEFMHLALPYTSMMKTERHAVLRVANEQENATPEMKAAA